MKTQGLFHFSRFSECVERLSPCGDWSYVARLTVQRFRAKHLLDLPPLAVACSEQGDWFGREALPVFS
jgi:hypothetical protein